MDQVEHPLKAWRERSGKTQPEAGQLVGVDGMTFGFWERGQRLPRERHWPKIQQVTGVTAAQLASSLRVQEEPV